MKKWIWLLIVFLAAFAGYYGYHEYWPSREEARFNPSGEPVVYMEGKNMEISAPYLIQNHHILVSMELGEALSNIHLHWDEDEAIMVVSTYDHVYRLKPDETFYMMNGRFMDLDVPMMLWGSLPYLPMEFLAPLTELNWIFLESENALILDEERQCRIWAEVIAETAVMRHNPTIKSPRLPRALSPGERLMVYEIYEKWIKVRTNSGVIGFVPKSVVKRYEECQPVSDSVSDLSTAWHPDSGKIHLP